MNREIRTHTFQKHCFGLLIALAAALILSACGGGNSTGSDSQAPDPNAQGSSQSKLIVSLTDAEGDFLTYQVDVTNIAMTRANGTVVNILPQTTTVDFAQYVEVTELLTIMDAPTGRYDSAALTLDFSDALITVQDDSGNPIAADVVDINGDPLTSATIDIQFNDRDGFVLAPGIPAHITLDFDLDASNSIDISDVGATVRVSPTLIADTILEETKTFRLRGLLGEVNVGNASFELALRPFRVRSGRFGDATVSVSSETSFEIDGQTYPPQEGLRLLATKAAGTPVVSSVQWRRASRTFVADEVYAGSSVPWDRADILRGTVVGREGDMLIVRGGIVELAAGQFLFNDDISVLLGEDTIVTRRGETDAGVGQISVGSAINATGDYENGVLDTSAGIVRIHPSSISGRVVSASPLVLDLSLINGRRTAIYDFTGTGTSSESDADPDYYELFTASLDLSGIDLNDSLRVRGYVREFGAAPEDFDASTVINAKNIRGLMIVNYGYSGSDRAISSVTESGIELDIEDAPFRHHLIFGGIALDLKELDQTPLITSGSERGVYSLRVNHRHHVYTFYSDFARALQEYVATNASIHRVDAQGYYDSALGTFSSKRIGVSITAD